MNSALRVPWLARQTLDSLCYSLPNVTKWLPALIRVNFRVNLCGIYTKAIIPLSGGGSRRSTTESPPHKSISNRVVRICGFYVYLWSGDAMVWLARWTSDLEVSGSSLVSAVMLFP